MICTKSEYDDIARQLSQQQAAGGVHRVVLDNGLPPLFVIYSHQHMMVREGHWPQSPWVSVYRQRLADTLDVAAAVSVPPVPRPPPARLASPLYIPRYTPPMSAQLRLPSESCMSSDSLMWLESPMPVEPWTSLTAAQSMMPPLQAPAPRPEQMCAPRPPAIAVAPTRSAGRHASMPSADFTQFLNILEAGVASPHSADESA